jgi:hypothetical protein
MEQRSFQLQRALKIKREQRLIHEALASGPEQPLTRAKMDKLKGKILRPKKKPR